jgi:hypothetical protein
VLSAVSEERATALFGVPTMFMAELECPELTDFDLTSLRRGMMSGAPCPESLMRRVVTEMHIPEMLVMYGQTEASPVITMSRPEDDLEHRVSTVGCAMPNTEVQILAVDTGATVPVGERGELCARGYLVMNTGSIRRGPRRRRCSEVKLADPGLRSALNVPSSGRHRAGISGCSERLVSAALRNLVGTANYRSPCSRVFA